MKKPFLFYLVLILPSLIFAQDNSDDSGSPKPEFLNQIYFLSPEKKLVDLEKSQAAQKNKSKLAGYGGTSLFYVIENAKSGVRIPKSSEMIFEYKLGGSSAMMDPSSMIRLYKFEVEGKDRKAVISQTGAMGSSSKTNVNGIPFKVKELEGGSYQFLPEKPLETGEYGFLNMMDAQMDGRNVRSMRYTVYTFGID